jgi:hypothetical protein
MDAARRQDHLDLLWVHHERLENHRKLRAEVRFQERKTARQDKEK